MGGVVETAPVPPGAEMRAILRLLDATDAVARVLAQGADADCLAIWRAIEELRDARQSSESLLRNFQELADCALDAMDSPMGSGRPVSRVLISEHGENVASANQHR
jgi:hypothetical protein